MKAIGKLLVLLVFVTPQWALGSSQINVLEKKSTHESEQMIDLASAEEWQSWRVINDGVMGGLSKGQMVYEDNSSQFIGEISLDNNGGFSSIYRSVLPLSEGVKTVRVEFLGDGLTYQLRFSVIINGYRVAYKQEFQTIANQRETVDLSISDFKASFRGRIIGNAPVLQAPYIREVGFLVTNKRPSKFALKLYRIDFLT